MVDVSHTARTKEAELMKVKREKDAPPDSTTSATDQLKPHPAASEGLAGRATYRIMPLPHNSLSLVSHMPAPSQDRSPHRS
eukprot:scaffold7243_cov394-Prasinococcus_capsulatus_cf.AAC.29